MNSEEAYCISLNKELPKIVTSLRDALGPSPTSDLAGTSNRKNTYRWAQEGGPSPKPKSEQRLRFAYRLWLIIVTNGQPGASEEQLSEAAKKVGHANAKAWFLSPARHLNEQTPIEAIAGGQRNRAVVKSAEIFAGLYPRRPGPAPRAEF